MCSAAQIGNAIASALAYLHEVQGLLHGDVKSANVLIDVGPNQRELRAVKLCDLGVSIPLSELRRNNVREIKDPELHVYEGTEPWRPPEAFGWGGGCADGRLDEETPAAESRGMCLCDRSDVFAFGLVIWEMLTGDVPHASVSQHGVEAYRATLGTRPPLPPLPATYEALAHSFWACTQQEPRCRPAAAELVHWLVPGWLPPMDDGR